MTSIPSAAHRTLHRSLATVFAIIALLASCPPLWADDVRMKNGDRITGTIIRLENQTLTVTTPYAGEMAIRWDQVASIVTDRPVQVVLEDKTSAQGAITAMSPGKLQMETPLLLEPLRFSMEQVVAVNPAIKPAVKFTGRLNAGIDARRGNTDTEAYRVEGELNARTDRNRYTIGGEANREEESGNKTADNWIAYLNYDHFMTQKWFYYTSANFERDDLKELDLRTKLGAGSGYQFFESEVINLAVKGGMAYVTTQYFMVNPDGDYAAALWAVKYDQYVFEKWFQLFHHHEGTVSLHDAQDILLRTRTGVRIPLRKGLNTAVQYQWDWDSSPAPGNASVDERYLITLGYFWE